MKKTNYLNSQVLEQLKLSRRKFCLCTVVLASLGILHATPVKSSILIENAIHAMGIDASTRRVGKWMKKNLAAEKSLQIAKEVEERLGSISVLSKNNIIEMISSDYSQERTVNITNIRFSAVEVALCIAASIYAT